MYSTTEIAILLATYNAENYINEQIDSLLNQTYQKFRIYIHDDGSTDGTIKKLREYQDRYPEKICVIDGKPTGGARDNFFYLMNNVEAPLYMFCDQDDVWLENKIDITYKKFKQIEADKGSDIPILVSTDLKVVNDKLEILSESMREYSKIRMGEEISLNKLLIQNYAVGCTLMFNRRLRDMSIATYNPHIIMHDWWMALIACAMGKYENLGYSSIMYRQHGDNSVGANDVNVSYSFKMLKSLKYKSKIIKDTRLQIMELSKHFPEYRNELIDKYAGLDKKCKIYRMYFHLRYGINKQGLFRKLGIILCC